MKALQIIGWIWFGLFLFWSIVEFTSCIGDQGVPRAMWWLQFSLIGLIVAMLSIIANKVKNSKGGKD